MSQIISGLGVRLLELALREDVRAALLQARLELLDGLRGPPRAAKEVAIGRRLLPKCKRGQE